MPRKRNDTVRLDVLARSIKTLTLHEKPKGTITVKSDSIGISAEMLRDLADGLALAEEKANNAS